MQSMPGANSHLAETARLEMRILTTFGTMIKLKPIREY